MTLKRILLVVILTSLAMFDVAHAQNSNFKTIRVVAKAPDGPLQMELVTYVEAMNEKFKEHSFEFVGTETADYVAEISFNVREKGKAGPGGSRGNLSHKANATSVIDECSFGGVTDQGLLVAGHCKKSPLYSQNVKNASNYFIALQMNIRREGNSSDYIFQNTVVREGKGRMYDKFKEEIVDTMVSDLFGNK